jgi:spore maturation protein A
MIISLALLLFTAPASAADGMTAAAAEAVSLTIRLAAVYTVWLGLIKVAEETGAANAVARALRPLIRFLFGKNLSPESERYIGMNMSSNIFGMGNAATPMGIKAMESLDDGSGRATDAMMMLLVVNACNLQLIPTTVIGLRAAAGSANAGSIVLPTVLSSVVTAAAGVAIVKIIRLILRANEKRKSNRKAKIKSTRLEKNTANPIQKRNAAHIK